MSLTKKHTAQHIRPRCDHKTSIERLTSSISGKFGLFIETIWNSHEHGLAQHIWITISGRGATYTVTILDDGTGMDAARRQRSLNMAMAAKVQTGRNYQDLGLKRLAAEFKSVEVTTISAEEKQADPEGYPMWVMKYDFDKLIQILADNANETITAEPCEPNWKHLELPKGSTGTRIHLTGARPSRSYFTAETLRRELCNHLPPHIAEKVFVNGLPLAKRQVAGEPFHLKITDHPKLGNVNLDLYCPTVKSARDQLKIGPFEGICDWRTFCQEIPEETVGDRFNILSDGVYGEIHVEAFKDWVTASRREFDAGLYASPLIGHFVDFMEHEVVPQLEHFLGVIKKTETSQRDKRLLDELRKYVRALGGGEKVRPPRPSVLTLDTTSLEVLPQQKPMVIKVDKHNPSLTIQWDGSSCGGKIEISHQGQQVKYWPGEKTGGYDLTCSYKEEPHVKAKVDISIVSKKELRVHPRRVTIQPGRQVALTALNWEDDSSGESNLRWRLASEDDHQGRFLTKARQGKKEGTVGYTSHVVYQAGYTVGTYCVEVYDKENRDKKIAYADITVSEGSQHPDEEDVNGGDVIIQGARYELDFDYMENHPGLSRLYTNGRKYQIRINRCHAACKHAEQHRGEDGLLELALGQVLLQHIDNQSGGLTAEEKTRQYADLYRMLAEGYEKSQQ